MNYRRRMTTGDMIMAGHDHVVVDPHRQRVVYAENQVHLWQQQLAERVEAGDAFGAARYGYAVDHWIDRHTMLTAHAAS